LSSPPQKTDPEFSESPHTQVTANKTSAELDRKRRFTMKTSISLKWIRLAALAAVSVLPGMAACTYSASANAPALGPAGGYVSVTVWTEPGCRWSVNRAAAWLAPSSMYNTGTGTVYFYVASTRAARNVMEHVYSDYISAEYTLPDGTIGGRSSVTGQMLRPILQFRITEN
jgi:hypothetical protein